jgi:hypothetical protein
MAAMVVVPPLASAGGAVERGGTGYGANQVWQQVHPSPSLMLDDVEGGGLQGWVGDCSVV